MLRISANVEQAFLQDREASFRERALDFAGAGGNPELRARLRPVLDHAEAMAGHYGLEAERSRLALFVLATQAGPDVLARPEIAAILGEADAPEHVRLRLLINHLRGHA